MLYIDYIDLYIDIILLILINLLSLDISLYFKIEF